MSDQSTINNPQAEQNPPAHFARPWIRHYEQGVPAQLNIPDRPLTWLLDQTVSRYPVSYTHLTLPTIYSV